MTLPTGAPIRVLVAEDEPAARRHLVRQIALRPGFTIVAEATSGAEAVTKARSTHPDVMFLDIQMPGGDGFDVVRQLRGPDMPGIVFVTAHGEYAIEAFVVHALDYLLKPFDDARLDLALGSVAARLTIDVRGVDAWRTQMADLVTPRLLARRSSAASAARLTVKTSRGLHFVPYAGITHLTADGYCAHIHTRTQVHHVRETLRGLEGRLPAEFVRVHRSAIVNLAVVQSLEPLTHGESRLHLAGGVIVKASRSYRSALVPLFDLAPRRVT